LRKQHVRLAKIGQRGMPQSQEPSGSSSSASQNPTSLPPQNNKQGTVQSSAVPHPKPSPQPPHNPQPVGSGGLGSSTPPSSDAGRRRRREEAPTFFKAPGQNFLSLCESATATPDAIVSKLKEYGQAAGKTDIALLIEELEETLEKYEDKPVKALLWLYTLEGWVYQDANRGLREDKKTVLKYFMPLVKGILMGVSQAPELHLTATTSRLFRRARLSPEQLKQYATGTPFLWAGLTSTSLHEPPFNFGPHLFIITVPDQFLKKLCRLDDVSAFPGENEVLLPCNMGLVVISAEPSSRPGTEVEICVKVQYEVNCV